MPRSPSKARGVPDGRRYDFLWTLGALLIAWAAWVRLPAPIVKRDAVTGLRAVALLLVAQAVAAGIQIYALFGTLARSERIITLVVLLVTSVQIVLSRPRPDSATSQRSAKAGSGDGTLRPSPAPKQAPCRPPCLSLGKRNRSPESGRQVVLDDMRPTLAGTM